MNTEVSVGTLHHLPLNNTTSTIVVNAAAVGAGWSAAVDCSSFIPVGTKAILCGVVLDGTAAATGAMEAQVGFSDNNSNTPSVSTAHPFIAYYFTIASGNSIMRQNEELIIPVSTNRTFYYYRIVSTNNNTLSIYITIKGYYL